MVTFWDVLPVTADLSSLREVLFSFYFSSSSIYFAPPLTAILAVSRASKQFPISTPLATQHFCSFANFALFLALFDQVFT